MPQSKQKDGAALALSCRESHCPEWGRLSLGIPPRGHWGASGCPSVGLLSIPAYSLCVCWPRCPSPLPQGPGRSSLLIRTRTAELQLCTRPAQGVRLAARRRRWGGQQRAPHAPHLPPARPPVLSPGGLSHQAEDEAKGSNWCLKDTCPRPPVLPNPPGVA